MSECANLITIAEVLLSNPVNLKLSSSVSQRGTYLGGGAVNKVRYNKTWLEVETHTALELEGVQYLQPSKLNKHYINLWSSKKILRSTDI